MNLGNLMKQSVMFNRRCSW